MSQINPYAPPNQQPDEDPPLVAQLAVDGEGMTVEFEQTFDDLVTFADFHSRQAAINRRNFGILVAMLVVFSTLLLLLSLRHGRGPEPMFPLFLMTIGVLAVLLILTLARKYLLRHNVKRHYGEGRNLNLIGIRRITITPEFVLFSTPLCQSATRWVGMERVAADVQGIYLYNTSLTAYILPRRAFNSDLHFQEYLAKATEYFAINLRAEQPLLKPKS